jgi:hypothetical protein
VLVPAKGRLIVADAPWLVGRLDYDKIDVAHEALLKGEGAGGGGGGHGVVKSAGASSASLGGGERFDHSCLFVLT